MTEALALITPALQSLPVWATLLIGVIALTLGAYMRARGASLEEHVSLTRATREQMETLIALNRQLNDQVATLRQQVATLEEEVETLRADLRRERGG